MRTVALGEVASFVRGVTFKPTDVVSDGVGIMRTKNVQELLELDDIMRIPKSLVKRADQFLREGDTLVSSANSWSAVGKGCWVPKLTEPLAIGGFVTALRASSPLVAPRYLYLWYTSPRTQTTLRSFSNKTTNISNLNLRLAAQMDLALPSLEEQRRIAAILDQAEAIRAKRRQVLAHLDSLTQAVFHGMFSTANGERVPIGAFAEVRSGSTPSRKDSANFGGTIPWVKTTEVQGGLINATTECVTDQGAAVARLKLFPARSVVVAMYGQGKTRGRSAILGVPATTNQACAVIAPNDKFIPEFLQAQLALSYERLRGEAEGGNQPNLSIGRVAAFEVFLPPVAQQSEFAAEAERVNAQRDATKRALAADDELFASLQSRAFRGEL